MTKKDHFTPFCDSEIVDDIHTGEVKLFLKQASQVNTAAKSRLLGDTIQRLVSLLQTRGGQAGFRDVPRWRSAGFPGKDAGEISRTHGDFFRQLIYAEVGGEVFEQPRQQIVNRALGGGLLKVIAAKLQLASRATQIHDEVWAISRAGLKP